jgi:hypothetical protein
VGRDHPEIKQALGRLLDTYDRNKWECMNRSADIPDLFRICIVTEPEPITGPSFCSTGDLVFTPLFFVVGNTVLQCSNRAPRFRILLGHFCGH